MAKELRRPFVFGPYAICRCCVEIEGRVVLLERRVKAVEGSTGVGCLIGVEPLNRTPSLLS